MPTRRSSRRSATPKNRSRISRSAGLFRINYMGGLERPPKPPDARKRPGAAGALLESALQLRAKAGRVVRLIGLAVVLTLTALAPVGANAQPTMTPRIGFLGAGKAVPVSSQLQGFPEG